MRRESAFAAPEIVAAGYTYVALGFRALPAVTLEDMVSQVRRGIEWVHANLSREIVLCGHSSGAHLSSCVLTQTDLVQRAILVSGIYDLAPVRLSSRNGYARIDERLEREYSPLRHVARIHCPVAVAWGEKESAEFVRQSREFAAALGAPILVAPGLNHFEVIEQLAVRDSPLARHLAR